MFSLMVESVVGALFVANKSGVCVADCVVLLHVCCCMSIVEYTKL